VSASLSTASGAIARDGGWSGSEEGGDSEIDSCVGSCVRVGHRHDNEHKSSALARHKTPLGKAGREGAGGGAGQYGGVD
jgi:hypothetical protein